MSITAQGVRRHFGNVRAVDGIDLDARPGAVTALIGPNGSGKTTLLLVLAGLLAPDAGTVRIAGHDPAAGPGARAVTGWMPDAFGTWDSLTAREVLTTVGAAYRLSPYAARSRAAELLELVHLADLADRPAHVLSRGQKQRLGLARALVHDPQVLLLDEPASGLDPRSRVDLRVLVRRLAAQGKTVLVSSHVLVELDEMADEAVFLSGGRSVATESRSTAGAARRPWRIRSLSLPALVTHLDTVGVPWRADDDTAGARRPGGTLTPAEAASVVPEVEFAPPADSGAERPGSVVVDLDGETEAAQLLRTAVAAEVPVTSLAPASGALESAYLALEEERR
ncbi:ABC transporter ATP-binding protein [Cellulomonas bogoriensis]|uniref:Multidrug ABC transporter ATPase n=1 Tax=Cellulomonas bogoriensis 69B4 = DSM 16987 TaxID=1386082 RepID=A0A0A0BP21_9CELL|nr:ABC transporter ATP-binding protein [Cellulomonas bogoriensis]KGM09437.1 multidrug ABC transporter ATPase [Cellulomonas bogoriensis 69B4 = DSM 16987]